LTEVENLLGGVTTMSDQAADQVLLKISHYVEDGPQGWKQTLVTPLRNNTLAPAGQVLAAVSGTSEAFKTSLHEPAQAALQQRKVMRDQIASFRSTHGL